MDLKNVKTNNKGFYYYINDEFVNVRIAFNFSISNNKEDFFKARLLSGLMCKSNKKYKSFKEINDKAKELYGLYFNVRPKIIGAKRFITFSLNTVSERIIEEEYFNDALEYFYDMIFKVDFTNEKVFNELKKEMLNAEKNKLSNPANVQGILFYKNVTEESECNNLNITDINEIEEIISSITISDLEKLYNEILKSYYCGYSFGDLTKENNKSIMDLFKFENTNITDDYNFKEIMNEKDEEIISDKTSQSYLYAAYDIKNYDFNNSYIYSTIEYMLNSTNGLCLNILREKYGIVYHAYAEFDNRHGFMYFHAQIDKKNKEKALSGIEEIFEKLHDKKEVEKLLEYAKEKQKELLYTEMENMGPNVAELNNYIFKSGIPSDERIKKIESLTVDDIINQIDNLEKKYTFFFRGDKDEK